MSDQAFVNDTQPLRILEEKTAQLSVYIARTIADVEADVGPRLRRLEQAVEAARDAVRDAENAYYRACDDDDEDGNVSDAAAAELAEARERLARLLRVVEIVKGALRDYKNAARNLADSRRGLLPGASAYMAERLHALDVYLALQMSSGASGVPSPSSADAALAAGEYVAFAIEAMNGVDLPDGFSWIPIKDIVEKDLPSSETEWRKGISKNDMRIGLNAFRKDMLPVLARSGHVSRDDFVSLDTSLHRAVGGIIAPNSLANLYDVFFGTEPIAVDHDPKGGLSITNGRHRIAMARELGWTHVPGRLLGRSSP
jgi:hypothetical protein